LVEGGVFGWGGFARGKITFDPLKIAGCLRKNPNSGRREKQPLKERKGRREKQTKKEVMKERAESEFQGEVWSKAVQPTGEGREALSF